MHQKPWQPNITTSSLLNSPPCWEESELHNRWDDQASKGSSLETGDLKCILQHRWVTCIPNMRYSDSTPWNHHNTGGWQKPPYTSAVDLRIPTHIHNLSANGLLYRSNALYCCIYQNRRLNFPSLLLSSLQDTKQKEQCVFDCYSALLTPLARILGVRFTLNVVTYHRRCVNAADNWVMRTLELLLQESCSG